MPHQSDKAAEHKTRKVEESDEKAKAQQAKLDSRVEKLRKEFSEKEKAAKAALQQAEQAMAVAKRCGSLSMLADVDQQRQWDTGSGWLLNGCSEFSLAMRC